MYAGSPLTAAGFEIGGAHLGIGEELISAAAQHDPTGLHHITAMSEPQSLMRILLDEEHRHLLPLIDFANRPQDLPDNQWRQAERRLVEQKKPRTAHQCPGDRQHLLFAARQRPAALRLALFEDWKQREYF